MKNFFFFFFLFLHHNYIHASLGKALKQRLHFYKQCQINIQTILMIG